MTYAGGGTGNGSTCSAAQNNAPDCTCGNRTYSYTNSAPAEDSFCNYYCPNGGSSNGVNVTSKSASAWNSKFNGAVTTYCNCSNNVTKRWSISPTGASCVSSSSCVSVRYSYSMVNECSSSHSASLSISYRTTGGASQSQSVSVTVPANTSQTSGSGTAVLRTTAQSGSVSISGGGSGTC